MSIFARVVDGIVAELFDETDGPVNERFQPEFVAALAEAPEGVEPGWTLVEGQFQPPAPITVTSPPRIVTPRQFMDRLPMERQAAITAAAMSSPQILLWLIRLTGALEVDLDNAETMEGVQTLAMAEILTEAEAEALLA